MKCFALDDSEKTMLYTVATSKLKPSSQKVYEPAGRRRLTRVLLAYLVPDTYVLYASRFVWRIGLWSNVEFEANSCTHLSQDVFTGRELVR